MGDVKTPCFCVLFVLNLNLETDTPLRMAMPRNESPPFSKNMAEHYDIPESFPQSLYFPARSLAVDLESNVDSSISWPIYCSRIEYVQKEGHP